MTHYVLDARTATPHFPGIGRYVRNLARAFAPLLSPDERLSVLFDPAHPFPLPECPALSPVPLASSPFSFAQQWRVPQKLRHLEADVYHSAYYLMPYLTHVPTVLTIHDLIPMMFPQQSSTSARLFFRWATALSLRAVQAVIAVSASTHQDLRARFRFLPDRVAVIPEAADPIFAPQSQAVVTDVRRRYQLPEQFILYLGSNKPHKNLPRLVEAWGRLVRESPPSLPLAIAGAWTPQYTEARELAEVLDLGSHVQWLGRIADEDLPGLYSAATVFVFPSLYEGFGLPPLEAMACGAPVACAKTSSLVEVVGDAALLFDPMSVTEIADTLRRLIEDVELRRMLRDRSLHQAARFSWNRTAAETLEIYREMASGHVGI